MRRFQPGRDVRSRLLTIVLVALALALAAATYGSIVLFTHASSRDANALLRARVDSELALLDTSHGRIRIGETSDAVGDSQIWIFGGRRVLEAPRAQPETNRAAFELAGGPRRSIDVAGSDERLLAAPIEAHGRRLGTLVAGLSLAPYEQTRKTALTGSLALALTLLVIVGFTVWWLLRSALHPVASMTRQAAAWSEHELDRRFELGEPHDEITRLGATLDALLDRIAASLRHERRFSSELSHELRTPLAKMIAEAELTLRRDRDPAEYRAALVVVQRNAQQLARIVETLVAAARQEAGPHGVSDAEDVARAAADACADTAAARGVTIAVDTPRTRLRVGIDRDLAERILHPVVDNACRYGRSRVCIEVSREGAQTVFLVADDGPGVESGERETIFGPAVRGSAGRRAGEGAGLGLALARRLARAASGEVEAGAAGAFVVRLPAV